MPPVAAIAAARLRTSSGESCVSRRRAIRQSGSFEPEPPVHPGARVACCGSRSASTAASASMPGIGRAGSARQLGATSGPMRMPSTTPTAGAERAAAAEQERVLAGARADRVEPARAAAARA